MRCESGLGKALAFCFGILALTILDAGGVAAQQTTKKELVAVIDLGILGGTPAEGAALSNQLRSELLATGKITLVDRSQMEAILQEQALQQSGCTSQECAVQVGQLLGVRKIVTGQLTKVSDALWQVSVQMTDVETGETLIQKTFNHQGDYTTLLLTGMTKAADALATTGSLAKIAKPVAPPPPREPKVETQTINKATWAMITSVALFAGSAGFGLDAKTKETTANDQAGKAHDDGSQSGLNKSRGTFDEAKASAQYSNILLAAGTGFLVYWFFSGDEVPVTAAAGPYEGRQSPLTLELTAQAVHIGWEIRW